MVDPKTMKGLRLEEFNKPYVYHTDLPVPVPGPGELLLKIKAASFCHTETVAIEVSRPSVSLYTPLRSPVPL